MTVLLVAIAMGGCFDAKEDEEKLLPHITVWNHTDGNLTVLLLPKGLPLRQVDNSKYYSAAEYGPESVEACYYYYSEYADIDDNYNFFSFSKTLEIYVFETTTYNDYSHRELLSNDEYVLAKVAVTKDALDSSGGFFEINQENGVYTITLKK